MQIVVMRSLYQNKAGDPGHPYFACCFVEHYGPVFEPQASAVTPVQLNLPMTEEPTPPPEDTTTNAAGDFLALSVLAANVPVPAFADGQSFISGFYPAPNPQTTPAPSQTPIFGTTLQGGYVLMSADLETGGGGGGAKPGGGGGAPKGPAPGAPGPAVPPALPVLGLPQLTIPVNGNTATVPVQCLVVDCSGTLTLQSAQQAGLARAAKKGKKKKPKKPRVVSYGAGSFSLKAGTTGKVKVTLNGAGRGLFKGHKKTAKVWANVRFSSGSGASKSVLVKLTK
jgi:hypothetical protein